MSAHTPGPWSVFNHSWCETSVIAIGFDHSICLLDINHATEESQEADEAQMEANARLIAAAPELLEALKEALACGMVPVSSANEGGAVMYSEHVRVADMIRAAVAKAEGKQ